MEVVTPTVRESIFLDNSLPQNITNQIREALRMKNPYRDFAKKEQIGGWWNIPEYIDLYFEDKRFLYIPRGFAEQLIEGLSSYDYKFEWSDQRICPQENFDDCTVVKVRDYQQVAVDKMLAKEQGVWEAPPGSGKTVTVLETIRRAKTSALVIVNKTEIAEQWKARAKEFLGIDIGIVGDGQWEEQKITIALQQTLWSRKEELKSQEWFDKWGFVCLDECHHLPANTFTEILNLFPAKYRIGVSGTPYKQPGMDDLIWNTLGPLFHKTEKNILVEQGWLIKPVVKIWQTEFKADFWPTHQCDKKKECMFKYCTRDKKKKRHQNNYSEIVSELIKDSRRNELIAHNVAKEVRDGHCVMILSKRLKHLDDLKKRVGDINGKSDNLYSFTGRERTDERVAIQSRADDGNCALFSTIADEALDIPRIDRIHLAFPTRNTGTIEQQIGRGERPHSNKRDTIINDYWDRVGPFNSQLTDRIRDVYLAQGLTMIGDDLPTWLKSDCK